MAQKKAPEDAVYRTHYEQVDATDVRPRAAVERRRQEEIDRNKAKSGSSFAPEAGPYGPNAEYTQVEAPADADHTSPAPPKE